ncbi:peptide MFS transporter [Clostridium botulinum]|uniref:Amino acid/peptide transporter n=1 Tax=Clostridium botulinum (strain Okra / Type B1) TaxID=498213 RepID=B1IFL8_CLOBK|nr:MULTISPECIES: peptide MFS transporter [Clostridium]ACA46411.1 amino acid/peptide transporter [Clostridium botulinum B1 str. Okra]APF28608.1 amino acid/peptide transporter family protein [Clostridium sporogenes]MBD5564143.1 peptide MFS transporter [Clostridium botulinum]MBD5566445.1 peptide MFS transporter [Clostridium botulinum]MBD5569039.1 peptide MFS transporter [Clostridium botulinum]
MENTNKKPFGFYVCSVAFTLERFAFYSAKWLLAVFVVAKIADGGLGLSAAEAAKMSANLVAFTYAAPLIGAFISDRFVGARYLVPIGMVLMGAGYLVGWQASSAGMVNLMIVLVSLGTGLFKCQTNAITGRLFDDPRQLDSAFSVQYSFVNIGSFIGTTIIGVLVGTKGYAFCFLVCGIMMFIDAAWFTFGWRFLGETGKKPFKIDEHEEVKVKETKEEKKPLTSIEKKRVAAIILVSFFSVIFWVFWYLAYMPVYFYWGGDNAAANWMIGNFQVPTAWFDSLNALACITLGPILGRVWSKLAKRPQGDLSMFKKTALGMILLGLSYVIFAMADVTRGGNLASLAWIVAFGIVLSLGEMVFSPLGNSFISKFSPPKLLSSMMSVWVLAVFFAAKSYGWVYEFTLKFKFAPTYFVIAAIAAGAGVILWLLDGKLNSLVVEEEEPLNEAV